LGVQTLFPTIDKCQKTSSEKEEEQYKTQKLTLGHNLCILPVLPDYCTCLSHTLDKNTMFDYWNISP
jgi:hypothetical protein